MARSAIRTKHQIVARVEAELLRHLRLRDGLSRVELARELQLAPSTAGIYVDRLLRDRFIVESHKAGREQGRPPTLLVPNPDGGRFVGVDFEARSILATVVDFSQQVVKQVRRAIREGDSVERILVRIEETIRTAIEGDQRPLLGIGVGVPGTIDPVEGIARGYDFIPGWKDVPLARRLSDEFKVPVYLENNIRSMAMAELWFGQGLGLRNFVCLGVRTGIGAGIVADGRLLRGEHGCAGEIGKWHVPGTSRGDASTVFRTLEDAASLPAILAAAESAMKTEMDFAALREAAAAGERKILPVLERAADFYGGAIHQLQLIFDPHRVILVGPLAELGSAFLDPLQEAVRRRSPGGHPEIVNSTLGQFSGAFGAAALALHQWQPAR
ncbi:ROK family protein [Chthoniobacter flavus Ellin428]|uniref:ROK family protein n=1 Tax=Chthoniobacter flavus Ellin428 TaxID=497964 RepID=B4D0V4_9BACT|nr:ROK family protein [Chthoniobacter flavus]EDY19966.1 ROK family protein [Chthoniobacter flavus Ellin428]TCO91765.1 putative NBD/HSP70 family sugar kinase [Chthoniobacter flavus]